MFHGNSIVVGKPNDLCDLEGKIVSQLFCEFHRSKGIRAVAIGNKLKVFRQLFEPLKGHAHGKDAGADTTVIGYLVADDRPAGSIHNEPDIVFDATDLDVGFVSNKGSSLLVRVLVNKGLDADGGSLAVVGDLLVGDVNVVQIFQGLFRFPEGKAKIHMYCQAQRHDVGAMFAELQGGSILRQGV